VHKILLAGIWAENIISISQIASERDMHSGIIAELASLC
jgi:hypothetical protein